MKTSRIYHGYLWLDKPRKISHRNLQQGKHGPKNLYLFEDLHYFLLFDMMISFLTLPFAIVFFSISRISTPFQFNSCPWWNVWMFFLWYDSCVPQYVFLTYILTLLSCLSHIWCNQSHSRRFYRQHSSVRQLGLYIL